MTKAQKALIKKRRTCTYCKKRIKAQHTRWMGDVTGCTISWVCECNRLPWPAHMDRSWFAVHEKCFCCGTVVLVEHLKKEKKFVDVCKVLRNNCKWHAEGTPAISWAAPERI